MRASIKECYQLTDSLLKLSRLPQSDLTDGQYDEIGQLLDRREKVLQAIKPPFTADEEKIGRVIVLYNKEIDQQLASIKKELAKKIREVKKQDKSTKSYLGYTNNDVGSYFLDKRN
ncbi:hypothetical protein [Bacillus sp. 1P06AnD]|uniref:hypothetical protein n=1 Tax=Bacillus sp. 1P06AnD TaxID=3132208 RepID=UPI0039A3A58D